MNGLIVRVRERPNGEWDMPYGGLFFPDGIGDYIHSVSAGTLTYRK